MTILLRCLVLLLLGSGVAWGQPLEMVVSVPGPRNLTYLPVDLIPLLGSDLAEGAKVRVRHFGGGGVALQELVSRNTDFAVAGLPAVMSLRANGGPVVTVAAVSGEPLFILMVRGELREVVKSPADLRGRVVGVNTSSLSSKTTSQQLAEMVLKHHGVPPDEVRLMAAGQSWEAQSTLMEGGQVDALMGDEPFASRLLDAGRVFFLTDLSRPEIAREIPGAGFLHAALVTREEVIAREPEKVATMVRIMQRTLAWLAQASPEAVVTRLGGMDETERHWLRHSLERYPRVYSPDGRFSRQQLAATLRFFQAGAEATSRVTLDTLVDDRWCGSRE